MTPTAVPTALLEALAAAAAEATAAAPGAPVTPTLEAILAVVLDRAGHRAAFTAHICAVPRRNSGWYTLPGYVVEPTTVRGQPAAYVGYQGDRAARTECLQTYAALFAGAGYCVQPVWVWPDRARRVPHPWERPDLPTGGRALLVQPPAESLRGDPGEDRAPHPSQGESPRP